MSTPDLAGRLLAELGDVSLPADVVAVDRELASLRVAVLLEQVLDLRLSDADLGRDLTDRAVLQELLARTRGTG